MKALSIRQPWIHAIFHLGKDIENRGQKRTFIIGERIALHASASLTEREYEECFEFIRMNFGKELAHRLPGRSELERGAILGTVKIGGVISLKEVAKGLPVSKWFVGEYGYLIKDRILLPTPIPIKGMLGFWEVPADIERQILEQL